ncbi:MAG: chromosomal replication initiator protein DnaA [Planctomycetota bacterium]
MDLQVDVATAWREILSDVKEKVSEIRYNLWFKNTVGLSLDNHTLVVGVQSTIMAHLLETQYRPLVTETAAARVARKIEVTFVVDGELFRTKRREEAEAGRRLLEEAAPEHAAPFERDRYALDSFVVGPCNEVAYNAALEVIRSPGKSYNPLFIHGGVGLGKTHLLVGIAAALGLHRKRRIEYVSAEVFTNRFLFALRNKTLDAFRRRYRKARLLVIDDIHFLSNKTHTQEEFLNTYKALARGGCQIVMASDSPPRLIGKLKESLVTRFLSGLVVTLDKPGFATRLKIVRHKCVRRRFEMPEPVTEFIARNIKGSIRELEGAVNSLVAYANLSRKHIDVTTAREALRGLIEWHCRPVRLPEIDAVITAYSGLNEGDLRGKRRTRPVSHARHLAMHLARTLGNFSYGEIGAYFGGRNHSSVSAAVKKISGMTDQDAQFAKEVAALKAEFGR